MINKNPRLIGGKSVRFTSYPRERGEKDTAIALVDEVGFQPRLEFERYIKRLILSPVKPKNPMCGNGDLYRFTFPTPLFSFFLFLFRLAISRLDGDFSFFRSPLMNYGLLTFLSTFAELSRERNCSYNLDTEFYRSASCLKYTKILNCLVRNCVYQLNQRDYGYLKFLGQEFPLFRNGFNGGQRTSKLPKI